MWLAVVQAGPLGCGVVGCGAGGASCVAAAARAVVVLVCGPRVIAAGHALARATQMANERESRGGDELDSTSRAAMSRELERR